MPTPIENPAPFVPSRAVAFAAPDASSQLVSTATPLPVTAMEPAPPALTGTASSSIQIGPYQPALGRPVVLSLSGVWSGSARVVRSTDNGATRIPLTIGGAAWAEYSSNCCEPVWEEFEQGAALYLDLTITGGTLNYRISQ
ncbi:hypothetical protein [Novosphingobium sp.]|uniref:hypothetical protein n=1 Tax=Novosphingobium sp. TaxID=1874826 RepID=UPI002732E85A|nr:hypothetical protein [Novosphingobium sp.]MDP3906644.1 hypothetical protein [Novosphingobium sp.]